MNPKPKLAHLHAAQPFVMGRKPKATPPNLPFSGEEQIARRRVNKLPPDKGGWGGCLLKTQPNNPAALFLANIFQPRAEYLLNTNGLSPLGAPPLGDGQPSFPG